MTVYVIDPSRPLPPSTGDNEMALTLQANDTVVLAEGCSVTASGQGSTAIGGIDDTLLLNGSVQSEQGTAISASGRIDISATGSVVGTSFGLHLGGFTNDAPGTNLVTNAGDINSKGVAILVDTPRGTQTAITNSGSIVGDDSGIWFSGDDADTDSLVITNTGLIEGPTAAIYGLTYGSNTVINSGHIEGNLYLGGNGWNEPRGPSTNIYDGRGGSIAGEVIFGAGNDIAYGDDGAETFDMGSNTNFVDGGGGVDTLKVSGTVDLRITGQQQINVTTRDTILNIENLAGGNRADHFTGNSDDNALSGGWNADVLDGQGGDDVLTGGEGNDTLSGGDGIDIAVFSGSFSDYGIEKRADGTSVISDGRSGTNDGQDLLAGIEYAQFADRTIVLSHRNSAPVSVSLDHGTIDVGTKPGGLVGHLSGLDPDGDPLGYFLVTNPGGHFRIQGDQLLVEKAFTSSDTSLDLIIRASDPAGASLDAHFTITVTSEALASHALSQLFVKGGRQAEHLAGGTGDDRLDGGFGRDTLTGHGGKDVFAFTTKLARSNIDRITDFHHGEDRIQLSRKTFAEIHKGALSHDAFHAGTKAADREDRIIYDKKHGILYYDPDGTGAHAQVEFAVVKAKTALTAHDFMIL